jgi:hypothetical protein
MPQFVSEMAETTRNDPTEGSSMELVVRVDSDSMSAAEEWIADHDGNLIDSLDHGLLEIELPEVHVSALCDLGYVHSVESTEETIEVLDQGN